MRAEDVIAATRHWIERVVIGLELCPFARSVYLREQIRYVVSGATAPEALLAELERELRFLAAADPARIDTTLLIHPDVLGDFLDYNEFLGVADEALDRLGLVGEIQIASFHPDYRFAGTRPDDPGNRTNRSPHPILHLLREASVARAVASHPDTSTLHERNIETMLRLGLAGWAALTAHPPRDGTPETR